MSALTKLSLLTLVFGGGAAIHGISISSGFYDMMNAMKAKRVLPNGVVYDPHITGNAGLDDFLGTLVQFFWPCADGNNPGLSLMSALFGGQGMPFFVIVLLEGLRSGNKGKAISYISLYGLLFQAGGLALVAPAYLLTYVFTSPTVTTPTPSNLAISTADLSGIPIALLLGNVVPAAIMSYPGLSTQAKIRAIALWQPTPIYTVLILRLWSFLSKSSSDASSTTPAQQKRKNLEKLRTVYKLGLAAAGVTHAAAWVLSLTALFLPQLYTPAVATQFHPLNSLIPGNPLVAARTKASSIAQGSLSFLQWDYWLAGTSYVIFALNARFDSRVTARGFKAADLVGLSGRLATLGPMGTALSYLWERDEIVLGRDEEQKKLR